MDKHATPIIWHQPRALDGTYYMDAHAVGRRDFERLRTHSVFGRITPLLVERTGYLTGCFPDARSQQDADDCLRFLQADFPAYGVTALNDYLESCIVDALLAGLLDDSDDWMEWGRAG